MYVCLYISIYYIICIVLHMIHIICQSHERRYVVVYLLSKFLSTKLVLVTILHEMEVKCLEECVLFRIHRKSLCG